MATFRPMNIATDAADMARLYSCGVNEPITVESARDWWTMREGEIRLTMLAIDECGQAIGYWDIDREAWMQPGHFYIKVVVAPKERGRGLGSQMYADALRAAREHGATHLESSVCEDDIKSLKSVVKRGFKVEHHVFESTLDLKSFNEHHFDALMTRLQEEGFSFFSLAEAGITDENKHKLYELNRAAVMDPPREDRVFPDYNFYSKNVLEASWFHADTQIIAACEDHWVGLATMGIYPADGHAYNTFTGVLRGYRGRGLAQALTLQTILLARKAGMRYIRTHNDSRNRSMLAVHRKLGYRAESGYYELSYAIDQIPDTNAGPV